MAALLPQPTRRDAAVEASLLKLLNTTEAAAVLGIGKRTLQERVKAREIACVQIGRAVRFHPDDLAAFVERNRIKAAGWKGGGK
jgi:excisionase family DNA binding protein